MSRRTTLGPVTAAQINARSSNVVVGRPSAIKPPGRRMTVAASAGGGTSGGRGSIVGGRTSMMSSRQSMVGRASMVGRRTTVVGGGDPRPTKEKQFMAACRDRVREFLVRNGFAQDMDARFLTRPSARDFTNVFTAIYQHIDPSFQLTGKLDEEIPPLFQRLRYPFTIKGSSLKAVGAPNSWPSLLAALTWLVETVECDQAAAMGRGKTPDGQLGGDDVEAAFFQYLGESYNQWLDGEDNEEVLEEGLNAIFHAKDAALDAETTELAREVDKLQDELQEYQGPSQLEQASERHAALSKDHANFSGFQASISSHLAKVKAKVTELKAEVSRKTEEKETATARAADLARQVQEQEIQPADLERMLHERATLQEALSHEQQAKNAVLKVVWDQEAKLSSLIETLETQVREYNAAAERLMLVPETAQNADGQDFSMALRADAEDADDVLTLDTREKLRPMLAGLREGYLAKLMSAEQEEASTQDRVAALAVRMQEKQDELEEAEAALRKTEKACEREREATDETMRQLCEQTDALETELQQLRIANATGTTESSRQLELMMAELETAKTRTHAEHERSKAALMEMAQIVSTHKSRIQSELANLMAFSHQVQKDIASFQA